MKSGALVLLVGLLALWTEPTSASDEQRLARSRTCPSIYLDNCIKDGNFCSTDNSCPGREICCKTSCGQECQRPVDDLPGYCPRLSPQPGQAMNCSATCNNDRDCGFIFGQLLPFKKCCSNGCGRTCQVAEEEHPGVCPLRKVERTSAPCKDTCQDDRDCRLSQKCCFTGCGMDCIDSVRNNNCYLPLDVGRCDGSYPRYYYDASQEKCIQFTFRACGGNSNNFETKEACEATCGKMRPKICKVPMKGEPCEGHPQVYYYNSTAGKCEIFPYEHCGGERFQFRTKLECMMVCGNLGMETKGK